MILYLKDNIQVRHLNIKRHGVESVWVDMHNNKSSWLRLARLYRPLNNTDD